MNQDAQDKLDTTAKNLQLLTDFCNKYDAIFDTGAAIGGAEYGPRVETCDATLAGKVFGKDGWTRKRNPYSSTITYNWVRTIDGVLVRITDAEVQEDMNDVPVPPKAFPIQLEDAAPSIPTDDIPF